MKKRLIAASMAAVLALMSAGCADNNDTKETKETKESGAFTQETVKEENQAGTIPGKETGTKTEDYTLKEAVSMTEDAVCPNESDYIDAKTGKFDSEGYEKAYNAWWDAREKQETVRESYEDDTYLASFISKVNERFLAGDSNQIYSPMNIYLALAMLSECAEGNSRAQLNDLLGITDMDELARYSDAIFCGNEVDDGVLTITPAASIWTNESMASWFDEDTLKKLADTYHASSFMGSPSDSDYAKACADWINDHTGNLLADKTSGISFDPAMLMSLVTTIYFKGSWNEKFEALANEEKTFTGADGVEESVTFMNETERGTLFSGQNFTACSKYMINGATMYFILPDEGTALSELTGSEELLSFINLKNKYDWEKSESRKIHLSLPKFDVSSELDLMDALTSLGVTDVFNSGAADFAGLLKDEYRNDAVVSKAEHNARVKIDEEGVEAAAYTMISMEATAFYEEEEPYEFICDRPFMFVICGPDQSPLFIGTVNSLAE